MCEGVRKMEKSELIRVVNAYHRFKSPSGKVKHGDRVSGVTRFGRRRKLFISVCGPHLEPENDFVAF